MAEDTHLLRQYAETGAQDAFAELVERHVSLVYSAALRQLGGARHRAEDVTQSVFVDLARQAGALARRDDIVGWLYTSTHYAAAKLKRSEARRQLREQEAHTMQKLWADDSAETHAEWERLRPLLDDAMLELNERDRQAVLLRFFRNEGFGEVGRRLGLSEDAARMRVDRALDKLHALLAKRGITSTASALGVALANQAVATAPAGLAASVVGAALGDAVGAGASVGMLGFMTATKTTIALGVAAALTVATALHQVQNARAVGAALEEQTGALLALRGERAKLAAAAQAEETALADAKATASREAAANAASLRADAIEKQKAEQAKALQRFLDADPELGQLKRRRAHQQSIRWHLPLALAFGLTSDELEQLVTEFGRRYDQPSTVGDVAGAGLPARLANNPRFLEAWKLWDTRLVVENFNTMLADPLNATQGGRLIQSIQAARPIPIPANGWDWGGILRTANWEHVLADASSYLSPDQMAALRGHVAMARTRSALRPATKEANP